MAKYWTMKLRYRFLVMIMMAMRVRAVVILSNKNKELWENIKLPKSVIPTNYNLNLDVDMEKENYSGFVDIKVNITQITNYILLHKVELAISNVSVVDHSGQAMLILSQFEYIPNEYYIIKLTSQLIPGNQYFIRCNFRADLRKDLTGLFITRKGNSKIAATFLSPIYSRKFFPCFDEPSFKAIFCISIRHGKNYNALSNMGANRKTTIGNHTTTIFKDSLPMSTYYLGVLIADDSYKAVESRTPNNRLIVQVWDFEGSSLSHATNRIVALLHQFEKHFFKIQLPIEKLDIAILPDYIPGAMENWGLMMFRIDLENYHLMAHEIVHQWFGNLVTMEFWDVAWIKEGFAQYLATIIGDYKEPALKLKDNFFDSMSRALPMDSFATSHPIVPEIRTPTDIRNVYDNIVYYKGEPVVHILSTLVGESNFQKGMRTFLQKYAYKNAKQDDLFKVMGEISGIDVKSFMDPWLLQMGYPLLTINRINKTHIEVEQQRFSLDDPKAVIKPSRYNYQWPVIITYRALNETKLKQKIMTGKKEILEVPDNTVLNPDHMQYYRIQYSSSMTAQIKLQLIQNITRFSINDRVGMINDLFFSLQARKTNLKNIIEFFGYLKNEKHAKPLGEAFKILTKVHDLVKSNYSLRYKWDHILVHQYVERAYKMFPGNGNVINTACQLNNTNAILAAITFSKNANTLNEIVCCALRHDTSKNQLLWHRFHDGYLNNPKSQPTDLKYLACTMNKTQLNWLFDHTMNLNHTNPGDATYFLQFMMRSDLARNTAWSFIKRRWVDYIKRYSDNIFMLKELISAVVPLFRTKDELQDVETFYKSVSQTLGTSKQAFEQAISNIKMNIELTTYLQKELKNI